MDNEETAPDPRAAASMAAFDRLPKRFREFCAAHPRTARGQSLLELLAECEGDVDEAEYLLAVLLPV